MHTIEVGNNPIIERIDLRQTRRLSVNASWRDPSQTADFLRKVVGVLADAGFPDIEVDAEHKMRQLGVIIGPIFYRLTVKENASLAASAKVGQDFMNEFKECMTWAHANCKMEPVLDQRGLHFFNDDDYLLFKMMFAGRRR